MVKLPVKYINFSYNIESPEVVINLKNNSTKAIIKNPNSKYVRIIITESFDYL